MIACLRGPVAVRVMAGVTGIRCPLLVCSLLPTLLLALRTGLRRMIRYSISRARVSAGVIAVRHAMSAMFECASIVPPEVAVVDHGDALGDIRAVIEDDGATRPCWRPCGKAPAEDSISCNRNRRFKRN